MSRQSFYKVNKLFDEPTSQRKPGLSRSGVPVVQRPSASPSPDIVARRNDSDPVVDDTMVRTASAKKLTVKKVTSKVTTIDGGEDQVVTARQSRYHTSNLGLDDPEPNRSTIRSQYGSTGRKYQMSVGPDEFQNIQDDDYRKYYDPKGSKRGSKVYLRNDEDDKFNVFDDSDVPLPEYKAFNRRYIGGADKYIVGEEVLAHSQKKSNRDPLYKSKFNQQFIQENYPGIDGLDAHMNDYRAETQINKTTYIRNEQTDGGNQDPGRGLNASRVGRDFSQGVSRTYVDQRTNDYDQNSAHNVSAGRTFKVAKQNIEEEQVIQSVKNSKNPYINDGANNNFNSTTVKQTVTTQQDEYDPFLGLDSKRPPVGAGQPQSSANQVVTTTTVTEEVLLPLINPEHEARLRQEEELRRAMEAKLKAAEQENYIMQQAMALKLKELEDERLMKARLAQQLEETVTQTTTIQTTLEQRLREAEGDFNAKQLMMQRLQEAEQDRLIEEELRKRLLAEQNNTKTTTTTTVETHEFRDGADKPENRSKSRVVSQRILSADEYGATTKLIIDGREITDPAEIARIHALYNLSSTTRGNTRYSNDHRGYTIPKKLIFEGREITDSTEILRIISQYKLHENRSIKSDETFINGKRLPDKLIVDGREITDPVEIARLYAQYESQSQYSTLHSNKVYTNTTNVSAQHSCNNCEHQCSSYCGKCGARIAHLAGGTLPTLRASVASIPTNVKVMDPIPSTSIARSVSPAFPQPTTYQAPLSSVSNSKYFDHHPTTMTSPTFGTTNSTSNANQFANVTIISKRRSENGISLSPSPTPLRTSGYGAIQTTNSTSSTYPTFKPEIIKLGSTGSSGLTTTGLTPSSSAVRLSPVNSSQFRSVRDTPQPLVSSSKPITPLVQTGATSSFYGQKVYQPNQQLPPLDTSDIIRKANESFASYNPNKATNRSGLISSNSRTQFNTTSYGASSGGYQPLRV